MSDRPFAGHFARAVPAGDDRRDLAWVDSVRGVAHRQTARRAPDRPLVQLRPDELQRKQRVRRAERLLLLVVDASGSMGGAQTEIARQLALNILRDAYVERDWVAMIGFRERGARILFEPTNQVERVHEALSGLPVGGTTPLASALRLARELLERDRRRTQRAQTVLLVSDGKANVGSRSGYQSILAEVAHEAEALRRLDSVPILFFDTTEAGRGNLDARTLAGQLGAERISLAQIGRSGRDPVDVVGQRLRSQRDR